MSVIIIEGPNNSGVSELAAEVAEALIRHVPDVKIRRWEGRAVPDDSLYAAPLLRDTSLHDHEQVVIWDRGWVSEGIQGSLLKQARRLSETPFLGEWLYGRAVNANGLRVMLEGPSAKNSFAPLLEKELYTAYGKKFGWFMLEDQLMPKMTGYIVEAFLDRPELYTIPPMYSGNPTAKTIFVGSWQTKDRVIEGGFLPFTTVVGKNYAKILGDSALDFGWVNSHECPPNVLRNAETLVACGDTALKWINNYVQTEGGKQRIILIPHPSYFGLEGNGRSYEKRKSVKQTLKLLAKDK